MKFAEVAVNAPVGQVQTFTYSIPNQMDVNAGNMVIVPFGSKTLPGIVFSIESSSSVDKTRNISRVDENGAILSKNQLDLAKWISQYYFCTLFQSASLMLPPGGKITINTYLRCSPKTGESTDINLSPFQQKLLNYIRSKGIVSEKSTIRSLGTNSKSAIGTLIRKQLVIRSETQPSKRAKPKMKDVLKLNQIDRSIFTPEREYLKKRSPKRLELIERLKKDGQLDSTTARRDYGSSAVNGLINKGWVIKEKIQVFRDPLAGIVLPDEKKISLTLEQSTAAESIRSSVIAKSIDSKIFLLEGVTGSGKTEIYLEAVSECIKVGKSSLVLVPEIALTHQIVERFASRFPGKVAVLHSGLTQGERFDQWWKTHHGNYQIVIGSRSAIFAPLTNLGMIILDEEHEWTYKQQDSSPRYHSRDVAIKLASITNSTLILGSASPDIGSYTKALRGDYRLLHLPKRIISGQVATDKPKTISLAKTELVDMRTELKSGHTGIFSRSLIKSIEVCLDNNSQAILFLNRRGTASYTQCRHCGESLQCRRCNVSMTYHNEKQILLCHYCGAKQKIPERCPICLRHEMTLRGIGTQAVVNEVDRQFPGTKVLRWDRDSITSRSSHESLLKEFRSGKSQILVGTQMIAKGLDFPSVTLVGVILADTGLNLPNFLASERSFQLLSQVAGRSGRGSSTGRVIIQTYQPENYAIKTASKQDYRSFYNQEMTHRHEQRNPPYNKIIRLQYSHTNEKSAEIGAIRFSSILRRERDSWGYYDTEVIGPTPSYPTRTKGQYRWQITMRGKTPHTLLSKCYLPNGWIIDVDPIDLV